MLIPEDDRQRAAKLINILLDENTPLETTEKIRAWFWSDVNPQARVAALMDHIKELSPNYSPDSYEYRKFAELVERLGIDTWVSKPAAKRKPLFRRIAVSAAMVSITLMLVVAGGILWHKSSEHAAEVAFTVGDKDSDTFTLPDGSTVRATKNTTVAYSGNFLKKRSVHIDGEAFFVVVPDSERPFTVSYDGIKVTVLGTEFSVRTGGSGDIAEVILAQGKVVVEAGKNFIELEPNQKASIDKSSLEIVISQVSRGELMRVSGEKLSFDDESLSRALQITADYFGKTLIAKPGIVEEEDYISMELPDGVQLGDVLYYISCLSDSFGYEIQGDTIVVTRR